MANYAVKATRKIRSEGSLASALQVFIKTNRFREDQEQYANARTLAFDEPTDDPIRMYKNAKPYSVRFIVRDMPIKKQEFY